MIPEHAIDFLHQIAPLAGPDARHAAEAIQSLQTQLDSAEEACAEKQRIIERFLQSEQQLGQRITRLRCTLARLRQENHWTTMHEVIDQALEETK